MANFFISSGPSWGWVIMLLLDIATVFIFLANNFSDVFKILSKNKLIGEAIKIKKVKGSTLVHIRRQDYLSLNEELNIKYYELALKEAARLIKDFNFSIFK